MFGVHVQNINELDAVSASNLAITPYIFRGDWGACLQHQLFSPLCGRGLTPALAGEALLTGFKNVVTGRTKVVDVSKVVSVLAYEFPPAVSPIFLGPALEHGLEVLGRELDAGSQLVPGDDGTTMLGHFSGLIAQLDDGEPLQASDLRLDP